MLDEDECGMVDGGGSVELGVDGPATAFVCSLFMATQGLTRQVTHNRPGSLLSLVYPPSNFIHLVNMHHGHRS